MDQVFKQIRQGRRRAMVDIWYMPEHKVHPVKNGVLDIMYGTSIADREKIVLPLTEVTAQWNKMLQRWDYLYGGGWGMYHMTGAPNCGLVWY